MINFFLLFFFIQASLQDTMRIFDFEKEESHHGWYIVNDGVMGGLSQGQFSIDNDHGVFQGLVSTENNGGFTMLQNRFKAIKIDKHTTFVLRVKGDGKAYQFRVKSDKDTRYSYVYEFSTSGQWQEVSISFSSLVPRFRGRTVDLPNFDGDKIEELAFLIGNKQDESFQLLIRSIYVE